jgi:hypothetical protein
MDDDTEHLIETDPAAEAFERLEGQMALVRRAVEHLARAKEQAPDYSETLGTIAHNLDVYGRMVKAMRQSPALALTPEAFAEQMAAAGRGARAGDAAMMQQGQADMRAAANELRAWTASARGASDQLRRLWQAAACGVLVGVLVWAIIPGLIARTAPEGWQWPERIAARMLRLDRWEAGERLLAGAEPERWRTVLFANHLVQDNREYVAACRTAAAKIKRGVRCTLVVGDQK